jgi:hypothetical protein
VSAPALDAADVDACRTNGAKREHPNYRFLFTGDKSWMFYAYDHRTTWIASWDDADEIERLSHFHQRILFPVSFNGIWKYKIAILPEG